jgi:Putative peptidoglycan binding domain
MRRWLAAIGWRRALVTVGIAVAAVAAAVSLAGGSGGASGPESPAKATGTAAVARRTLAERLTATGTIGYAGETTVIARLSGTLTALPAIGNVIRRGEQLYAVAGEPVFLMYGVVPAYRDLAEGVSEGPDVEQLERNLAALGYEPGSIDEEFTYTTAEAVGAWQEGLGLEETGEVELGRVAFLRGPQRVTELAARLGEALGGGGGSTSGGNEMVAWHPEAEGLGEAEEAAEPKKDESEPEEEEKPEPKEEPEPQREKKPEPEPKEEPEAEPEPGSVPVLRTSSTRRIVSVELEADQQSIAHRGQKVEVILSGGTQVSGRVRRLAAVESSGGEGGPGEEAEPALEATISATGKHRIPALDGATVSVRFTQCVRRNVLSVPLTALVAIGGERFAVVVEQDGARRRLEVTPGLAADGYVEVKGDGLREGMRVEVAE